MGADRITSGSMARASYDSPGALVADQITGMLGVVTQTQGVVVVSARAANIPQQTALTAITTAQTLYTQTLPAGYMNLVGRSIEVKGSVIYSTTSTNVATITIAIKLGSVTLASITTAATNTAASSNLPLTFDFILTTVTTGTSGTINAHGNVTANIGTAASPNTATYLDTNTGPSSAVDLTVPEALTITIAASAAVPSAQLLSGSVNVLA